MVEHTAVNRGVVGSSPTRGAFWLHGQVVKTSPFHGGNTGSSPVGVILCKAIILADMAQLAEQLICNQQVIGSSPIVGFMAQWLSWLERRPVTAEVGGSSPPRVV